jgi:hypothetical protein
MAKAVLEFYVDKPLESRRLAMAAEGKNAFAVLGRLRDFCMARLADSSAKGSSEAVTVYQAVLETFDDALLDEGISLNVYDEYIKLLEDL